MKVSLKGCRTEPLGSYLKALAVLRIVSEQADEEARGWWEGGSFEIDCHFDGDELLEFFLKCWKPTPIVAPWNAESGFYPKNRQSGIQAIAGSDSERFAVYRRVITLAKQIPEVIAAQQIKAGDEERHAIVKACRNTLPDACVDWLDAAVGLSADGKRAFAPILGTGGNEGRLDYTNTFMEYVAKLLIEPDKKLRTRELLRNALFGTETGGFKPSAVGQYDPGRAGGFNQGPGVETKDIPINPWNFLLTLEGAVAWAAGLYRRQGIAYRSFLCSPFTVNPSPIGYGSSTSKDKSLARAEIWTPLWERPARYAELKVLLREGRASVESKPARTGLDFATAASTLGVDRGITGFTRFELVKRRGDSYIALKAGSFKVRERRDADLVHELDPILEAFERSDAVKATDYEGLRRQVDEAIYDLLLRGEEDSLLHVASSVGRLYKRLLITGKRGYIQDRLKPKWLGRLEGNSHARVAAALAGIWDPDTKGILQNLDASHQEFAWTGRTLSDRMLSVLQRRILSSEAKEAKRNPVGSSYLAPLRDVMSFMEGQLNDDLIEDLLFASLLIDFSGARSRPEENEFVPWPVYALLKHLFLPHAIQIPGRESVSLRSDRGVLAQLAANRVEAAAEIAIRRLRNAGLTPVEAAYTGGIDGPRLGAALLIPVLYNQSLERTVVKTIEMRNNTE